MAQYSMSEELPFVFGGHVDHLNRRSPSGRQTAPVTAASDDREIAGDESTTLSLTDSLIQLAFEESLAQLAGYATRVIPGADAAGLTLGAGSPTNTSVATMPFVSEIDRIQYLIGEGPFATAVTSGIPVVSGRLDTDPRWPRLGRRITGLGPLSVLSLPLVTAALVNLGVLSVYAYRVNAFRELDTERGEVLMAPAVIAMENAQTLAGTKRPKASQGVSFHSRSLIDRAIGIMTSHS